MNKRVSVVAEHVEVRMKAAIKTLPSADAELRSVFNGPPMRYLQPVLALLASDGGIEAELSTGERVVVPVLLPLDSTPAVLPPIGESGECDRPYLISLRNTPSGKRWVAITPPSAHDAKSVTGATDEFGLRTSSQSRASSVAEWFEDPFIESIVSAALHRNRWTIESSRDDARRLLEGVAQDAEEAGGHGLTREGAWAALSRVLSMSGSLGSFSFEWSLACGVPPMPESDFDAKEQLAALNCLAEVLEENGNGFTGLAERLNRHAEEAERGWIADMVAHLRASAVTPMAFSAAPQAYFAPALGDELSPPPEWWSMLTAPRLIELLGLEVVRPGAIELFCDSRIAGGAQGLPNIVRSSAALRAVLPEEAKDTALVEIRRELKGKDGPRAWAGKSGEVVWDPEIPHHVAPIRYVGSADGHKKATIRVIALDSFAPGVVITARTASKLSLPKKVKGGGANHYECHLEMRGEGRHFLDLLLADGAVPGTEARGEDSSNPGAEPLIATVTPPLEGSDGTWGVEVLATTECYYDLEITLLEGEPTTIRLNITAEEADPVGCASEFDRLLRLNTERNRGTLEVQLERQSRIADLQSWLLESAAEGIAPYPIVVATDADLRWQKPSWKAGPSSIISSSGYIHDPRPLDQEFSPPDELLALRSEIATRIRGDDGHGMIEGAELGAWMSDPGFAEVVDSYVRTYLRWLDSDPDVAPWAETVLVVGRDGDGTLAQVPTAVLLTPLHPLRLGWHALAQRTLIEAWRSKAPCPAASILDPDCVPDALTLPLRAPNGSLQRTTYLSADSSSDYWSILWNAGQLGALMSKGAMAPFGREFGLQLGGVTGGFRVSQVKRALDDVSLLMSAKPILNVLVTSSAAQGSASTEGVIEWSKERFGHSAEGDPIAIVMGDRVLQVFDEREPGSRPTPAEVANLSEDTNGAVRWFAKKPAGVQPDLGIIAQLETANASADSTSAASPLGAGALIRHRVRSQLRAAKGAFLTESRMGAAGPPSGDALTDHVSQLASRLENLTDVRLGFTFAPRVGAIQTLFEEKNAEYVAVSSSAVDPACFLGGWLEGAYLWDYELPSYSNRPGDTSGYYLLSRIKGLDCDALRDVLGKLPGCASLDEQAIQSILLEVSRRGIPTVRGLSAGHSGAAGDLGLFLAGRLLQDEFRVDGPGGSLLPVIRSDGETHQVVLVVPADPFQGYLFDLQRALKAPAFLRPDMVVVAFSVSDSTVRCRVTPIEVKYRQGTVLGSASKDALAQAASLSTLLRAVERQGADTLLWRLAYQHLLLSIIDFGFRVYSQQPDVLRESQSWDTLHQRVSTAIISGTADVEVDDRGRLIVFDASVESSARDVDGDGFEETMVIAAGDAGRVARGEADKFFRQMRSRLGHWGILPRGIPPIEAEVSAPEVRAAPTAHELVPLPDPVITEREPELGGVISAGNLLGEESGESSETPFVAHEEPSRVSEPTRAGASDQDGATAEIEGELAPEGVVVRVGSSAEGFHQEPKFFKPSITDLNQMNVGVVGDLGTGKTQLLKSLIAQVSRSTRENSGVKPRFLIFDYKKDYIAKDFVEAVGAKVVVPRNMPLNLFDTTSSSEQVPWMARYTFFADVLDKIYTGVGPVQRQNLKAAVKAAHEKCAANGRPSTIHDVQAQYEQLVKGKADAPLSIISDMVDMELFTRNPKAGSSFAEMFDGVVVISLAELGQNDRLKNMVVAIVLNLFYEFMLTLPKRPYRGSSPQLRTIDSFLLVDEADNIMRYEFDVLKNLLLQGREFGIGVILASQFLRHFKVGASDYREPLLTWFIHKVPNITAAELGALGLTGASPQQHVDRIKQLEKHHCLYKSLGSPGVVIRGLPFYELEPAGLS